MGTEAGNVKPGKSIPPTSEPPLTTNPQSTGGRSELEDEGNEEDETLLSQEPVRVPKKAEPREVSGLADPVEWWF